MPDDFKAQIQRTLGEKAEKAEANRLAVEEGKARRKANLEAFQSAKEAAIRQPMLEAQATLKECGIPSFVEQLGNALLSPNKQPTIIAGGFAFRLENGPAHAARDKLPSIIAAYVEHSEKIMIRSSRPRGATTTLEIPIADLRANQIKSELLELIKVWCP